MDHPIIFSGPMIRAILDGRKTMTRRLPRAPWPNVQPGDKLWVRERWRPTGKSDGDAPSPVEFQEPSRLTAPSRGAASPLGKKWRPSIHLPRRHSRLTLFVQDVRRESIFAISDADILAEGCRDRVEFTALWDTLHPRAWRGFPSVIVIQFEVGLGNIDQRWRP